MPEPEELSNETAELERISRRFELSWLEGKQPRIDAAGDDVDGRE